MSSPTADWEKVGDRFYRKIQLYTQVFDQDLELENYVVAGAPYGGAIGMCKSMAHATQPIFVCSLSMITCSAAKAGALVHIGLSRQGD